MQASEVRGIKEFRALDAVLDAVRSGFHGRRILVLGDVMLDRHVHGSVQRISPEAPVPVVRIEENRATAGGAGNVAANLVALGLGTELVGVIGDDEDGVALRHSLRSAGIGCDALVLDPGRPTTTKTRVVCGHQQMLRLDNEVTEPVSEAIEEMLLEAASAALAVVDAVILSDYAKGALTVRVCEEVIARARKLSRPVLVDPKGVHWEKYRGASRITPNRSEMALVSGNSCGDEDAVLDAAGKLREELRLGALTVTLSEAGMLHVDGKGAVRVPAMARELFDVSGAGDTAIATLAAAAAAGLEDDDGLVLANVAAGLAVARTGTVAIGRDELLDELLHRLHGEGKALSLDAARRRVQAWQARGEAVVFTNGCFDILHAGHVSYLAKARAFGDRLVVGLNSDTSVRRLKGESRPINSQEQRALVLSGLEAVDAVVIFDQDTPLELVCSLRPQVLAKGADYRMEDVVGAPEVLSWGGRVELVELVSGVSTTSIAARMSLP